MDQPKVSVIIGIYNCEKTLDEAIESILMQTYSDWEMILCDDGSTDNSYQIAEKYAKQYSSKVILLKNDCNRGLNYTLNRCLEVAQGEYVARMDGDDISLSTRFEKQVHFLDEHSDMALVSAQMVLFDEHGEWGKVSNKEYPQVEDFCGKVPFFCHAACMIRRSAYLEVGGYTVNKNLLRVEDCHLWFKIYSKGYRGANLQEVLYKMRDDRNATKRRTFSARKNGIYVMFVGFRMLKMPWYRYLILVKLSCIEMIKVIIPNPLYEFFHRKR